MPRTVALKAPLGKPDHRGGESPYPGSPEGAPLGSQAGRSSP